MKRNSMKTKSPVLSNNAMLPLTAAVLTVLLSMPAVSGIAISDFPLQSSAPVPPNILFILDDSGSMANTYMPAPEATSDSAPTTNAPDIGQRTYARNGLYYNPAINYEPWKDYTGTAFPIVPVLFNAAYTSTTLGTVASGTTDLSTATRTYYVPKDLTNKTLAYLNEPVNYWRYQIRAAPDGRVIRSERVDAVGATAPVPGDGCDTSNAGFGWRNCASQTPNISWVDASGTAFTRTVADEKQNFAIWYSFHRTRTKIAKYGASDAFSDLGPSFRVGFTTIWGGNDIAGTRTPFFIPVATDGGLFIKKPASNRSQWFDNLFAADAGPSTPLKGALQQAGLYYSRTDAAGPNGPETGTAQLACRQNFAILTTDGFWNATNGYNAPVANADSVTTAAVSRPSGTAIGYTAINPYTDNWSDTLGDIANFYWKTDLQPGLDNIVPETPADPAYWQHMVTYGISIGLQGTLDPVADLPKLTAGIPNTNGTTGWPDPTPNEDPTRIDDLFHAAVNGHGKFIAAQDPKQFSNGLKAALEAISKLPSSNSNASANSTALDDGSLLFQAKYVPAGWTGELVASTVTNGVINTTPNWSASGLIPVYGSRNILTWNGSAGSTFPTAAQTTALTANVANFIRGDRSNEKSASNKTGTLRERLHLLGDIVNSSPAYEKQTASLYVGANDGMLHSFNSVTGVEQFAYVPGNTNLTNLKTLSDPFYSHRYFVDGAITVSTSAQTNGVSNFVSPNNNKNILVGALGRGGKGVFALDVTNPTSMTAANVKWESNLNILTPEGQGMGNVLGRSFIAKLNNGMTAVIVANGPNSIDEKAELFIYDLNTGVLLSQINTGAGSAATPNGLSSPIGWDNDNDGDVDYIYSGDLLGNMWKFDISSGTATNWSNVANRTILYTAYDAASKRQPITGRPTIARDPDTYTRWVFFGTGQFLTDLDPANKDVQTWYGVQDDGSTITGRTDLQQRKIAVVGTVNILDKDGNIVATKKVRGFEPASALTAGKKGWYVDLVTPPTPPGTAEGERMVGDQRLFDNILIAASIVPSADPCLPGGSGFINAIDAFTGSSISTGFFDVNGDGSYDETVGTGADQVPVGSIDFGVGMGTNPLIGTEDIIQCGSGANCRGGKHATSNRIGRISWREILGN